MAYIDFIESVHKSTARNYIERVTSHDKAHCAKIAAQYGQDYWDGDRCYGFGGYKYDGRWRAVAEKMAKHYGLKTGDKILDVGCGKGFLLYEFTQIVPGIEVYGIDISQYALEHAKEEILSNLQLANATNLPFEDNVFDFVFSITTLHNLPNYELDKALREIERVGKQKKHIVVESFRNESEKVNLLYWQLTCRSFYSPEEWEWFFERCGYSGDYGCIYFE
jgi:SAM-dependent methyltransferase